MKKQTIIIRDAPMRNRVMELISQLDIEKAWEVTVAHHRQNRSLPQNSLVHSWFSHIAESTGDDAKGVKEDMITAFCPMVESKIKPGVMRNKRTHELTTAEMATFVDSIYKCACEFGIFLPHPDDRGRG